VTPRIMSDSKLIRASIALVWLYQGLWCKLMDGVPQHEAVIAAVPFIGPAAAKGVLIALGWAECCIAAWVLSGKRMRYAALAQTALLVIMNAGGTIWAPHLIADPGSMIVQNLAFLVLIWIAAGDLPYAARI
jgi:DoxX-like family